jgi:DNA polymerase elongation subunit (family B)
MVKHPFLVMQIAPTREQVGGQPAMEAIPLVMEPESRFYHEAVLVLDFQSLYPSIIIAYNLCFSTCLGSPQHCQPSTDNPLRLGVYQCVLCSTPFWQLLTVGLKTLLTRGHVLCNHVLSWW